MKIINIVRIESDQETFAWLYDDENKELVRARIIIGRSSNPKNIPTTEKDIFDELNKR